MSVTPNLILLMGLPGSGRSTQADRLNLELALPKINIKQLLLQEPSNSLHFELIQEHLNTQTLVPDDILIPILMEAV